MKRRMMLVAFLVLALLSLELPTPTQAAAPPNDDFDHAEIITSLPYTTSLDTTEATRSDDDPVNCLGGFLQATVWYAYTPVADGRLEAQLNPNFDASLTVWTGSRGALTLLGCRELMDSVLVDVHADQTYYFMIGGLEWGGPTSGLVAFTMVQLPPPLNDDFNQAIPITALPFSDTQDLAAATRAEDDPVACWEYNATTVWYSFTPAADMKIFARGTTAYWNVEIAVFTGARGALSLLACSRDTLLFDLTTSTTYYFAINGPVVPYPWMATSMSLSIRLVTPPANDNLASAINIAALPFTDNRDVTDATVAPDDPYGCLYNGATVWYTYTPTANKRVQIDTTASNFNPLVSVFVGSPGDLQNVTCSSVPFRLNVFAGQTYYFDVNIPLDNSESRNLIFMVQEAVPYLAIDIGIDRLGSVNSRTKLATLHGTVQCNQQAIVWLSGSVTQRVGRAYIRGYISAIAECSGPGIVAWSSSISTTPVPPGGTGKASTGFLAGGVTVAIQASAYNWEWYEFADDETAGRVTLANSH